MEDTKDHQQQQPWKRRRMFESLPEPPPQAEVSPWDEDISEDFSNTNEPTIISCPSPASLMMREPLLGDDTDLSSGEDDEELLDGCDLKMLEDLPVLLLQQNETTTAKPAASDSAEILQLPDEVLAHVGSFLNVGSLKGSRLVCQRFCRVFSRDEAGWVAHCQRLWHRKIHVSPEATAMLSSHESGGGVALEAFRKSCVDARLRHEISPEELIYDPDAGLFTVWDFRFKEAAGMEWTVYDPWYAGLPARKMVFLRDGTVRQLVNEIVWNVDDEDDEPTETVARLRLPFHDSTDPVGVSITWRFVDQPMDLPKKGRGAYIRLTVGGRDVPSYVVHRSPTGNWGFLMENCWGVFASFTLPPRQFGPPPHAVQDLTVGDGGGRESLQDAGAWSQVSEATDAPPALNKRDLLEDPSLSVTNRWQWREALLYNLGSTSLPDGPTAAADFDHAWHGAVRRLQAFGFSMDHIVNRMRM